MPRKRKTPKEGSSAQGQPSELRVHGQQQRHGQSEQTEHGQTSQPQPHLQQSHQRHVQTVSQEGLLQGSPGSLQRLEQPQQTLEAAQGREYIQSLQHQQGCGPPLPYHGQAAKGKGRVGEAQGTRPVSGLSIGSYVPVATVGPSIPDLRQAVLSHATPYQQAFVGADIGHQTLPLGRPSLLPPESAGPPLEEHFQKITLQASKPEVAGPSQVQAPPISSKKLVFPRRPGKGQTGIKCLVKANHFITELPEKDLHQYDIKRSLRGIRVEVTHRGEMRRKYRIVTLTSQPTQELTFPMDDNSTMKSVVEYFREHYNISLQQTQLPCLQVGNQQRPNYLPMEVCKIVAGQRYSKKLNDRQISALLRVTCQRPQDRENAILQTVYENAYNKDPYAKEFGIKISDKLASVEARILPAPRLKYHDSGKEKDCQPEEGQWNMLNKKMVNGGKVNYWACINFSRVQENLAGRFCQELAQMCQTSGMEFNPRSIVPLQMSRPDQVESALKRIYTEAKRKLKEKELELLIAVLPANNGSLYGDLKRICETDLGIVSQCCLEKHVLKMSKQYMANVALKINVKAGGRNTVLVDALRRRISLVSDVPTIIFGADVTHPHPGEDTSPSIAAVVASQDWPEVTKYVGLVSAQAHRQEMIEDLFKVVKDPKRGDVVRSMIRDLLRSFYTATGRKPMRIIFYRDGVSEGQFYQVLLDELEAIRRACMSIDKDYQPPVTFIVVQKRHHTRLFAHNHRDRNSVDKRSGNILPGTVVDSTICHPTEFDFYLCSHAGIQGTSRPAHYHVLWDDNRFSADALQSLTNNLCYTYARCTRSVSIVPPAYYAHLAAFRARFYIEPETSDNGSLHSGLRGSSAGPSSSGTHSTRPGTGAAAVRPLPAIKENVKRVMFYC